MFSMQYSMNSGRTENCNSFHPGQAAAPYYGDGGGRDFGIVRSYQQLGGTSQGGMTIVAKTIGLPKIPAPIQSERGHPPGYTGYVPGKNECYGETYGNVTARYNTPRDNDNTAESGSRTNRSINQNQLSQFSTSSSLYGAEVEESMQQPKPEAPKPPPLSLGEGRTGEDLEALNLLHQPVPRAKPMRSQRFDTRSGFNETQLQFVRKLDLAASFETAALAEQNGQVIVMLPIACQVLELSEERVRGTALSFPGAHLVKDESLYQGSLSAVAIPQGTWDKALENSSSS